MAVTIKYGSKRVDRTQKSTRTSITWQGTEAEIDAFSATLLFGSYTAGRGQLTDKNKSHAEGPIYNLDLTYTEDYDDSGNVVNSDTLTGPYTQKLQARMISMPLETHQNYRARWNYYLIGRNEYSSIIPLWWSTASDTFITPSAAEDSDYQNYRWVKALSEIPEPETGKLWAIVKYGTTVCRPTKPGVESYDKAFYVITETGEHKNKTQAGWATAILVNKIVSAPLLGDFGLTSTGYDWKVDDIDVSYNGKRWVANRTYTMSGDANGWDTELYDEYTE